MWFLRSAERSELLIELEACSAESIEAPVTSLDPIELQCQLTDSMPHMTHVPVKVITDPGTCFFRAHHLLLSHCGDRTLQQQQKVFNIHSLVEVRTASEGTLRWSSQAYSTCASRYTKLANQFHFHQWYPSHKFCCVNKNKQTSVKLTPSRCSRAIIHTSCIKITQLSSGQTLPTLDLSTGMLGVQMATTQPTTVLGKL